MSPDLKRQRTLELLAAWNLALSELQPLVLVVEDLHWCDPSSLAVLGRLIVQSATARVLLLATARPEFTAPWPARSNLVTLQLGRLTKREVLDMLGSLGGSALPADTLDALMARADGVPLYVEELTKAMVEPGAARGVEAIPATLADSLMGRLDRLSAAKEIAQRAAVLGREFSYALLAAVAGLEDATLRYGLERLVEAEILFVRGEPPEAMCTFKHALVQEAAYDSLLKRTRQQLHSRVADVLMAEFPERAAAEPEVVAGHEELAGRTAEAIAAYQRAGEQAQARSAHAEAIRHLRHAISLLKTEPEGGEGDVREIPLQLGLGRSLGAARGFTHPEVEAPYERARVLCEATGDARQLGFALDGLTIFCANGAQLERACMLGARMLAIAEQSGDSHIAVSGHFDVGVAELYQGKFRSSLAHLETARALYSPGRAYGAIGEDLGPTLLAWIANDLSVLGWRDRAIAGSHEAVVLARQLGYPLVLAHALFFEAFGHWRRRDVTAQLESAAHTIALSEAYGYPLYLGVGRALHAAARV
jgi:tetratricopeptide (TPR) repeat protein